MGRFLNRLLHDARRAHIVHCAYLSLLTQHMISISLAAAFVLVLIVFALAMLRRRGRSDDCFKLGTVSQQWLLIHKGEDR